MKEGDQVFGGVFRLCLHSRFFVLLREKDENDANL
jgi:hypothetical protein